MLSLCQPEGLVLDDLLTREDCTTYGWEAKRKEFVKLLDRYVRLLSHGDTQSRCGCLRHL